MINRQVPQDDPELSAWDMLAEMTREAEKNLDHSLALELEGLAIRGMLVNGDPAQVILQTAQAEKADLIIMPSHSYTVDQLLPGSVTAKVLHGSECPVSTGAHREERGTGRGDVRASTHHFRSHLVSPQIWDECFEADG